MDDFRFVAVRVEVIDLCKRQVGAECEGLTFNGDCRAVCVVGFIADCDCVAVDGEFCAADCHGIKPRVADCAFVVCSDIARVAVIFVARERAVCHVADE